MLTRDIFLILHFIGLTMAVGTGFANLFLGYAASKLEPSDRGQFMSKTLILIRMGQIGLGLLLLSGFYLITPYWNALPDMPTLIAKLTCVALLLINVTVVSLLIRKAQQENDPAQMMKLRPIGMINFFLGLAIIILAVLTFH
jgi:uncharacterized membrane protein